MRRLDIKITFRCNNFCRFCAPGTKRDRTDDMSWPEIMSALDKARRDGAEEVVINGGEPTLHPDFLRMLKYVRGGGYQTVHVISNGRMFYYRDFCARTIMAGANCFTVSLHGHNARVSDGLTAVAGGFKQSVEGIQNLIALRQRVSTNTVITQENYIYLPQITEFFAGLGVSQVQFAFIHIMGTAAASGHGLIPRKKEVVPYAREAVRIGAGLGIKVNLEAMPFCLMPDCVENITDDHIPETEVCEKNYIEENFTVCRRGRLKAKAESCRRCKYDDICEGPWKEYPEMFGWEEFKPVTK
jgi:MoaA/NifB/PqqE/SkfB family radical SAM enzyme